MSRLALETDEMARRHWALCFLLIAFLHLIPALVAIWWLGPVEPPVVLPPTAVMIDMAPLPVPAPVALPQPPPPRPARSPPLLDLPRTLKPAVPSPVTPPHPPVRPEEPAAKHDMPATPAPAASAPEPAPPASPAVPTPPVDAVPTWRGLLLGRLEQFKRYPALAQMRRQQGVVYLRFVIDRDGKVLSSRIERSAGYSLLDEETQALLERAQPLPKPPPEIGGDTIELVVPIEYFLRAHG